MNSIFQFVGKMTRHHQRSILYSTNSQPRERMILKLKNDNPTEERIARSKPTEKQIISLLQASHDEMSSVEPVQVVQNPETGEIGGPPPDQGDPTRYSDWNYKGRVTDF
mmetsp:Transcript_22127/g.32925  ORF Transcript_22127/g.32925 Transcript_22127/m.32925 type:complete len:109 (+) Transcript_22127:2-328(+)